MNNKMVYAMDEKKIKNKKYREIYNKVKSIISIRNLRKLNCIICISIYIVKYRYKKYYSKIDLSLFLFNVGNFLRSSYNISK